MSLEDDRHAPAELRPVAGETVAKRVELLFDLGPVAVFGDLVREDVLPRHRHVGGVVVHAARARNPLLGVDHHVLEQARARERREREQRRGRVAAGIRDDPRVRDPLAV